MITPVSNISAVVAIGKAPADVIDARPEIPYACHSMKPLKPASRITKTHSPGRRRRGVRITLGAKSRGRSAGQGLGMPSSAGFFFAAPTS